MGTILLREWRAAFGMAARATKFLILAATAAAGTAQAQTPRSLAVRRSRSFKQRC